MRRGVLGAAIMSLVLAAAPAHASPNPGSLWISISAEYRTGTFSSEWTGFLAVGVPLDRLAQPAVPVAGVHLAEGPPKKQAEPAEVSTPPASKKRDLLPLLLTPKLARGAVQHALLSAGYYDVRGRLRSLSSRSRSSAALPELRLRAEHSAGQTLRLTPTTQDPYRYTQAGTSDLAFEARLTWHLDRLVFANEEVRIERLQNERDAAERRLIDRVLQRLALWQRSRVRALDVDSEPEVRETAEIEAVSAAVELDVLTDGWFSHVIGESDDLGASAAGESTRVEVDTAGHAR